MTKWSINDPEGFVHGVELDDKGTWWGMENIGMGYNIEAKYQVQAALQRALLREPSAGIMGDWVWVKV